MCVPCDMSVEQCDFPFVVLWEFMRSCRVEFDYGYGSDNPENKNSACNIVR